MIKSLNISHQYSNEQVLTFPDISLNQGDAVLIIGESGCGKSTLLHILSGLLAPTNGDVLLKNQNIYSLNSGKLDSFRGGNIGIVFQVPHFVNSFSVEDNLLLTQKLAGNKKNNARVVQVLEAVQMLHKLKARVFELSQGEKQRVSIARALINSPNIIFADEPTSALDDKSCSSVISLLKSSAKAENAALVIVTHDQRLKEAFNQIIEL